MRITEVFPNPTVKQVIFQITFPNLFYIESKIGDLQLQLMDQFPESGIIFRRQVVVADVGAGVQLKDVVNEDDITAKKIWEFKSDINVLHILTDSLDISSEYYKTYNNEGSPKFREAIALVLDKFLGIMKLPTIQRVGLRYIDECPIAAKDNDSFQSYYQSVFPLGRFPISEAEEMDFKTLAVKGDYRLRYIESLRLIDGQWKLILDFDGFATNVRSGDCLAVTDSLHDMISEEYQRTIRDPVYEYMRQRKEG